MPLSINGERIPDRVLERELLRISSGLQMDAPEAGALDPAQLRSYATRNVVDRTLLLQAAVKSGVGIGLGELEKELTRTRDYRSSSTCEVGVMETLRENLLLDRAVKHFVRHVPRPSRDVVQLLYRRNPDRFWQEEAVEAAHILCGICIPEGEEPARAKIAEAAGEIRRGKPFAQVANRYSDCKGVGESVGWVTRGQMVEEFEQVLFAMVPGQCSGIFRTAFGFHIVRHARRRSAGTIPFSEVHLDIATQLLQQARDRHLKSLLDGWRAQSDIRYT